MIEELQLEKQIRSVKSQINKVEVTHNIEKRQVGNRERKLVQMEPGQLLCVKKTRRAVNCERKVDRITENKKNNLATNYKHWKQKKRLDQKWNTFINNKKP